MYHPKDTTEFDSRSPLLQLHELHAKVWEQIPQELPGANLVEAVSNDDHIAEPCIQDSSHVPKPHTCVSCWEPEPQMGVLFFLSKKNPSWWFSLRIHQQSLKEKKEPPSPTCSYLTCHGGQRPSFQRSPSLWAKKRGGQVSRKKNIKTVFN